MISNAASTLTFSPLDIKRFWDKVEKTETCWNWIAGKNEFGYGRISIQGKRYLAHRISYVLNNGFISNEINVCHSCDNPSCVNPSHLWLGTDSENAIDKFKKGRGNVATGSRHHSKLYPECVPKGEDNGNSKLKNSDVIEIRKLLTEGMFQSAIAKKFDVTQGLISAIRRGSAWKSVTKDLPPIPPKERNGNAKLFGNQVKEIRELLKNGVAQNKISKMFSVTPATICDIKLGRIWVHIQ